MQPCWETSCGSGNYVTLFKSVQMIGLHQGKQTAKEITETFKIGLRTVQCINKTWKESGEPLSSRKKLVG